MCVFKVVLLFCTVFIITKQTYSLHVDPNGIYSDIVVEISDKVPRQKCQRALDNLEVSNFLRKFIFQYGWNNIVRMFIK